MDECASFEKPEQKYERKLTKARVREHLDLMYKCASFESGKQEYARKLAEATEPSEQQVMRESADCQALCLSISRGQVVASFEAVCTQQGVGFPYEGEGVPYGFWERQRQWFVRVLAEVPSESERERLNNALCVCISMQQVDVDRRKALLTARLRSQAELAQDRREVEGLLTMALAVAELELRSGRK